MDKEFTQKLYEWLNTPKEKRDLAAGALMVLQCDRNKILYNNVMRMPAKYADVIEYNVNKWYNFRLQHTTHEQVEDMARQVENIVEQHNLYKPETQTPGAEGEKTDSAPEKHQVGKRPDHDQLPLEIQALFVENLDILHRMREVHMRLRQLSENTKDGEMCPDSDRFPFLQELISLDKTYHANWKRYDTYVIGKEETEEGEKPTDDASGKTAKGAKTTSKKGAKTTKGSKTTSKKTTKATAKKTTATKAKK